MSTEELSCSKLKSWAFKLLDEDNSLGDVLMDYANAWEYEVREALASDRATQQEPTLPLSAVLAVLPGGRWCDPQIVADDLRALYAAPQPAPVQASTELVAQWDDLRVQMVYAILCDGEMPPNQEEHWEGYTARRIVDALFAAPQAVQASEPVAWMREWDGDVSDEGNMMFVANADERDEPIERWQPLYAAPQPAAAVLSSDFNAWWESVIEANGGVRIGADWRHWAKHGWDASRKEQALQALSDSGQAIENLIDAERYRWSRGRDRWASTHVDFGRDSVYRQHRVCWHSDDGWHDVHGQSLDEAVDAARAAVSGDS